MGVNVCFCCSSKDTAITIGIWSLVYSVASLILFGWQTNVLNRCQAVTMSQANLNCQWDCPCIGSSVARTQTIIQGLFVIQVLCLISAFFMVFASAAFIYGVHSWSKYLVWPWFPVMLSNILSSLAYCIMWWCGDVRSYWLALTIIEIIVVFINIYCIVIVMMYYRKLNATTDKFEHKDRRGTIRYKINRNGTSRRDLLESYDGLHRSPEPIKSVPYRPISQPPYPVPVYPSPYSPSGMTQTPLPMPPMQYNTPYPMDPNEFRFEKEPKKRSSYEEDPVGSWVREQRSIVEAGGSEPIPTRNEGPMKHSRSFPSLYDGGTSVSHHRNRDKKHRSSSRRHRSKSRYDESSSNSSNSEKSTEISRHHRSGSRRHRRKQREESEATFDTRDHRRGSSRRHHRSSSRRHKDKERDREKEKEKDREREREREKDREERRRDRREKREDPEMMFPGITIPQHIVIPPSAGELGPDGKPRPHQYQINSEITINYDKDGRPIVATPTRTEQPREPYRRRYPMQIQSNV